MPHRKSKAVLALLLAVSLASCGGQPQAPTGGKMSVVLTAAADVNPNAQGTPAPVKVRIFELSSDTAFRESAFRDLQSDNPAPVAQDLTSTVHWEIVFPGVSQTLELELQPTSRFLGIVPGFRSDPGNPDVDRAIVPLRASRGPLRRSKKLAVEIGRGYLSADL